MAGINIKSEISKLASQATSKIPIPKPDFNLGDLPDLSSMGVNVDIGDFGDGGVSSMLSGGNIIDSSLINDSISNMFSGVNLSFDPKKYFK